MAYLLDANTFIEAKNRYYSFGICPGFWDWLKPFSENQNVLTINAVKDEILKGEDELSEWFKELPSAKFLEANQDIQKEFRGIMNDIQFDDRYSDEARRTFMGGADPWLIATAKHNDYAVVTHEALVGPGSRKIKIPNICKNYGIEYINIFELLEREEVSFHYET